MSFKFLPNNEAQQKELGQITVASEGRFVSHAGCLMFRLPNGASEGRRRSCFPAPAVPPSHSKRRRRSCSRPSGAVTLASCLGASCSTPWRQRRGPAACRCPAAAVAVALAGRQSGGSATGQASPLAPWLLRRPELLCLCGRVICEGISSILYTSSLLLLFISLISIANF